MNNTTTRHRIFLTGSTGVLGSHVLKELLSTTEAEIVCLVRAPDESSAVERIWDFLRAYDPLERLRPAFRARVTALPGDVTLQRLGLGEEAYADLAARTDVTLHVAASTNLFLNYRRIAPINVGGTRNIVDFARVTEGRYLAYVSTHTVVGDKVFDPAVTFRETDYDIGQGFSHMNYQRSKFEAEGIVRETKDTGLRWNIFRPGQIFGEGLTGRYPLRQSTVSGLFYDILKTVMDLGVAMKSGVHFDVVPVDYVSRGIVRLVLGRETSFETYHLTNPDIKDYTRVIGLLERLGFPVEWVEQPEYERRLRERLFRRGGSEYKSSTVQAFRWWFKRGILLKESGVTDCTYTRRLLEQEKIVCPPIDERLLAIYYRAGAESGYFGGGSDTAPAPELNA